MICASGLARQNSLGPGSDRRVFALPQFKLAPTTQARSLAPAQRTKAPPRTRSTGTPNALATSASNSFGTGTGARGPAPEAQVAGPLAADAGKAHWSAPIRSATTNAHWPALSGWNISPPCIGIARD